MHYTYAVKSNIYCADMLCHPVLALYITQKWKKAMMYLVLHPLMFFMFLTTYWFYIKNIFGYEKVDLNATSSSTNTAEIDIEITATTSRNQDQVEDHQNRTILPFFLGEKNGWHLANEICFLIMIILLSCLEFFQLYKFKKNYFKQRENLHQFIIIGTAITGMLLKPYTLEGNLRGELVRGAMACGFCISCFEFVFVVGKYPFCGGDFSIMFSRVLRKLSRYVIAMFMIVGGFSVGLNVITYGTNQDFQFETPFRSFVLTLTMAMGEFNANDLYHDYDQKLESTLPKDREYLRVGRTIAMIILVCMILAGTITMVNLFVAAIISDKEQMDVGVFKQKLFLKAEGSELIEKLVLSKMESERLDSLKVCIHKICGTVCTAKRVPPSIARIVPELLELAKKNENQVTQNSIID